MLANLSHRKAVDRKGLLMTVLVFAAGMAAGTGTSRAAEPPSPISNHGNGQEFHAEIAVQNNMTWGSLQWESGRSSGEVVYDAGRDGRFEVNATCGRKLTPFLTAFGKRTSPTWTGCGR